MVVVAQTPEAEAKVKFYTSFKGTYRVTRRTRAALPSGRILQDVFEIKLTPPESASGSFLARVGYQVPPSPEEP
jgi:hypothetical protein